MSSTSSPIKKLGASVSKSADTIYQADTDGYVEYAYTGTNSDSANIQILVEDVTPPTVVKQRRLFFGSIHNQPQDSLVAVVKKGDYWKVVGGAGTDDVLWTPFS